MPIDPAIVAPLGSDAIAEGLALTVEAGWNQTADDWAFFIANATVLGARERRRLVATAAILPYPAGFAWVSLVIVAKSHRGRGLGTQMLARCIEILRSRGLTGMLDATPAGERVYTPLGFQPLFRLRRWEGAVAVGRTLRIEGVAHLDPSALRTIASLDAAAFGADRSALLADYGAREATQALVLEDATGYALVRRGRTATHVGPLVAPDEPRAAMLLRAAIAAVAGPVFVDVPERWEAIEAWLRSRAFRVQRPFLRMALGRDTPCGDPGRIFAIAGPEYG